LQFFKTFVVIRDGSEQGTPWHFVRDNRSFKKEKKVLITSLQGY